MAVVMIAGLMFALSGMPNLDDTEARPGRSVPIIAPVTASAIASATALPPTTIVFEPIDRQRTRDAIARFRVTPRDERAALDPRIASQAPGALDPMPGDRSIDMTAGEYRQPRRREPGAAVDARMSMRLDGGQRTSPDFGVGGIGGALMRVTSALMD